MTVDLESGEYLDYDELTRVLGTYLWEGPETMNMHILRCKGLFRGKGPEDDSPVPYML